ncbi:hypothetical protein CAQUA_01260 [Corynebacterium aquatimens]|nr:hypothetical protein CAQUA_01260 [Corynebacterium aquatimens]
MAHLAAASLAALTVCAGGFAPAAHAGGPAPAQLPQTAPSKAAGTAGGAIAGPGAPLRLRILTPPEPLDYFGTEIPLPQEANLAACSQGFVGHVNGSRVMVTAGHCLKGTNPTEEQLDSVVYSPLPGGLTRIGETEHASFLDSLNEDEEDLIVVANQVFNSSDWGTVRLDPGVPDTRVAQSRDAFGGDLSAPVELVGVRDWRTLGEQDIVFDNFGQPICKDGYTTQRTCGTQLFRTRNGVWSFGMYYDHGDSGGINFDPVTREILGVSSQGIGPLGRAQPADVVLETAYGIPDGEVNARFKLTDSTAQQPEFTSMASEQQEVENYVFDTIIATAPPVDVDAEYDKLNNDIGAAIGDTAHRAGNIAWGAVTTGNVDAARKQGEELLGQTIETGMGFNARFEQIQLATAVEEERAARQAAPHNR